jgi:HEAT repeat-containing protein 5
MLSAVATAMEARDPFIIGAMEGTDEITTASTDRSARSEPTAMFFAIFSLVYEALSGSTPYSEPFPAATGSASGTALRAMKSLVRREYSGKALLEPTIFNELLNLWYRMAMTEPPALQIQLVEVIHVFATEQGQRNNAFVALLVITVLALIHGSSDDLTSLAMVCLRVCTYILKNALPSADGVTNRTISFLSTSSKRFLIAAEQTTNLIRPTGSHSLKRLSRRCCPLARPLTLKSRKKPVPWRFRCIVASISTP